MLRGRDPSAVAVLMEDSAAVAGLFLAGTAVGMAHYTGNVVYDALGSITIGGKMLNPLALGSHGCLKTSPLCGLSHAGLMAVVALFLVQRNGNALVGQ